MTYTISGKPYTLFDIDRRCAEIMKINVNPETMKINTVSFFADASYYEPTKEPECTWPIIEKCWESLIELLDMDGYVAAIDDYPVSTRWEYITSKHNCTKLVAACICLIDINDHD